MWFTVYYNSFISNPGLKINHSLVSGKPFCSDRDSFSVRLLMCCNKGQRQRSNRPNTKFETNLVIINVSKKKLNGAMGNLMDYTVFHLYP